MGIYHDEKDHCIVYIDVDVRHDDTSMMQKEKRIEKKVTDSLIVLSFIMIGCIPWTNDLLSSTSVVHNRQTSVFA